MSSPFEAFARDYDRLRNGSASFWLDDFALLELSGEDRVDWLQGQATNDIRNLIPGSSLAFCFCEPTGQILAPVDAWALEDRILMTVPRELAQAVLDRVEKMTIMEDVVAKDLTDEFDGLWHGDASSISESPTLLLASHRLGRDGFDAWIPTAVRRHPVVDPMAYEASRIEAGVPRWGLDFGPRTLPAEMGSDFERRNVNYAKGCYTGQEVLMRMHSRGHSNKTWVGLISKSPFATETEVLHEGKAIGRVSSAAPSPTYGWVGAATLRNEAIDESTVVRIGDVEAEVRPMPIARNP